jgi:hypothetical protein
MEINKKAIRFRTGNTVRKFNYQEESLFEEQVICAFRSEAPLFFLPADSPDFMIFNENDSK